MRIFSLFGLRSLFGLQKLSSLASLSVIAGVPLLLSGCALTSTAPSSTSSPTQSSLQGIRGVVHGGQQPIAGAQVYVFAAGTGGNGGNGIAASTANASTSLLFASSAAGYPTTQNLTGTSTTNPLYGDYYVTTDSFGNFGLTGEYTCTAGTQVYLYALGGDPSPGVPNAASGLLAALGQCPASGSMASVTPTVVMNEVSTVAAAYAMAGFATDAVHISSSGTALAQTGIANAFANATNLENIATGTAYTTTPGGNGTVPQTTINTIANILAACINSTGPTSTGCTTVFSNILSGGASGTAATDTATAAIYLAQHPYPGSATQIGALYKNPSTTPPFAPALTSTDAPNDFTIAIAFTDGATEPTTVAIDAGGNVWVQNQAANSLSKLSPLGIPASGSPFTGNGLITGYVVASMAIDPSGNVWFDQTNGANAIAAFTNAGTPVSGSPFTYSATSANVHGPMAIDANGNIWIVGTGGQATGVGLNEISNSGTVLSPGERAVPCNPGGYYAINGYNMNYDGNCSVGGSGIAIDKGSNNVFTTNPLDFSTSSETFTHDSGTTGLSGHQTAAAYDSFGSVWVVDGNGLARFTAGSNPSNVYGSEVSDNGGNMTGATSIAIDGAGNLWLSGQYQNAGSGLSELSSPGTSTNAPTLIAPNTTGFFASGNYLSNGSSQGIALDGSGDLWYAGPWPKVYELIGIAAPVITPLSAATASSSTGPGTRP
jgi:hypothetical protein